MGLLTQILTFPLAPVRGVGWVVEQVARAAGRVLRPRARDAGTRELEEALTSGRIDGETFDRREDELLERLEEIRRYRENPQ
ncbi:gas vesicle protein GvpG [Streptomyces agglomeratus]|uniref:gas vesicle protein GvpG n=1 Tax=Streptomyces agglomeratus TaxID=285458 RepID=UPI00099FE0B9|nr:gas vesicle protein GvpG [Streptomyces agglomeratus]